MDLNEERKKIIAFAKSKWRHLSEETYEDIGSYAVEKWLTGRNEKTNYQYIVIDFLRSYKDRIRMRGGRDEQLRLANIEDHANIISLQSWRENKDSSKGSFRAFVDRGFFDREEKIILSLIYEYGFNQQEIADMCGISESRICQRVQGLLARIQKTISKDKESESIGTFKRKREMEKVLDHEGTSLEFKKGFRLAEEKSFKMESFNAKSF
jgi:RNA polymerase sigma factor (sigma-70 family)